MDLSLLIIAGLGLVAIVVGNLFKRFVPEIVVFLALGVAIGPEGLNLINDTNLASLELLTQVALGAVIFLIGDRLRIDDLREQRFRLVPMNLGQLVLTGVAVFFAVQLAGASSSTALLLALIATETGVLTVSATVREERSTGPTTNLLLSSVGVTNVATAVLFGFSLPFILATSGEATPQQTALVFGELIVLSTIIGFAGGWVLKTFSRSIESSGELLLFLIVILTAIVGAALAVEGSVVISTLIAGLYVANSAPWLADRLFATVRTLEAPIYLIFFVVAGAGIHLEELAQVGIIGVAYAGARAAGKIAGATLGGLVGRNAGEGFRLGMSLLPHAGMAIALVALVVEQAPELGPTVSGVVLGSIVVFELGGPIFVRRAIRASGEAGRADDTRAGVEVIPEVLSHRSFNRVLVPMGSIDVVLPRLPFLLDLVGTMRASLIAVHISRPGAVEEGTEPEVLGLVEEVARERNIEVTKVHKVSESVAQSLVAAVRDHEAQLVVMGEPARTSLLEPSRWGMISQRVVRDVDVPVLVYPVDPSNPEKVPSVYLRRTGGDRTGERRGDQPDANV
ncbi:cation:proton antiporter [Euzebya sp.]|uniref:cation:proton antiporter n=1 Tax=Euzebya sp. TaxID=1971409 RepID=UPI00351493BA